MGQAKSRRQGLYASFSCEWQGPKHSGHLLFSKAHSQGSGLEAEMSGYELAATGDVDIANGNLTDSSTAVNQARQYFLT